MPYPKEIDQDMQKGIKRLYAEAQFGATIIAVSENPTLSFLPLVGIQAAPFLMTLVRKGKITAIWYHRVYALTLWFPFHLLF